MKLMPPIPPRRPVVPRLVVLAVALAAYLGVPTVMLAARQSIGHFPRLARAFGHGRLDIVPDANAPLSPSELIPSDDGWRLYCGYPPLPAVLLMPFVAAFGLAVKVEWASRVVSVINAVLFDACLGRMSRLSDGQELRVPARLALNLLFILGTVTWHNALMGGDWHLAHTVALAAMLLGLREYLGANRPWAVGCFTALAMLSRPTTALTCLFFVMPLVRARSLRKLASFAIGPGAAVMLLGLYNQARFGSPFDFGYTRMLLVGAGQQLMEQYGQFHPHFIAGNLFWYFLAPPWPLLDGSFPWLGFDPRGLSLFISCPAMLYVFAAIGRRWRTSYVQDACLGTAACLVPLLTYFNTGYWQFGHRFAMDYLPLLMVLTIVGMGARLSRLAYASIAAAILIQCWGVLLYPATRIPIGW